jgi:hybrid cluster-associated redox disulfide protein
MKSRNKITKNTIIGELIERNPKTVEILTEKYGLHCVGCGMVTMETLEMGARAHGMTAKEINRMVAELNKLGTVGL